MAGDHARIRRDIWADEDFRELTSPAQWLYLHLITSPSLTFVGVCDWRPARIAAHSAELTPWDVEVFAAELERGHYIVVDRRSEEVLIRSWIKHDGLMHSPNMVKALVKAHSLTSSNVLRAVVIGQLQRLRIQDPDLRGWDVLDDLDDKRSMTPDEAFAALPANPSVNPSADPSGIPSANGSRNGSLNGSATPVLLSSLPPVLPNSPSSSSDSYIPSPGRANGGRR